VKKVESILINLISLLKIYCVRKVVYVSWIIVIHSRSMSLISLEVKELDLHLLMTLKVGNVCNLEKYCLMYSVLMESGSRILLKKKVGSDHQKSVKEDMMMFLISRPLKRSRLIINQLLTNVKYLILEKKELRMLIVRESFYMPI